MASPSTTPDATAQERERLYADRWSTYGTHEGIAAISERPSPAVLRRYDLFSSYDDAFLETLSHDIAIANWKRGSVLFEEGSYLDLAFYIVQGTVDVYLQKHGDTASPIFSTAHLGDGESLEDTAPTPVSHTMFFEQVERMKHNPQQEGVTLLSTMDFDLPKGGVIRLEHGDIFGEIGALNGWPQSVTARAATDCTLVQIRLPALRQMKRTSSAFSDHLDEIYRGRTLSTQLRQTPMLRGAPDGLIETLTTKVELVSCDPGDVVARQDEPVDALYLVRSGFLKISQRVGAGELAVNYLSKGMMFGQIELLVEHLDGWESTISSVGYSELVRLNRSDFEALLQEYPAVESRLWESVLIQIKQAGQTRQNLERAGLIEFSLDEGLVQGNSILVIDLDVCTRCDDCVRGCASTHGGRPRFVREGEKYGTFMIARSCYHCEDPVCLIGCPTGAIRRANVGAVVEIDDNLCIGCSNCAKKCPYDAIVMHDTGDVWPDTALPSWLRGRDRQVASKCDLCYTSDEGPACVNNCPHSCAFRVSDLESFQQLLQAERMPS